MINRHGLPFHALHTIDRLCDRFEQEWKKGELLSIEELLADLSPTLHPAALEELLHVELELLAADGEVPDQADYRARFPAHESVLDMVFSPPDAPTASESDLATISLLDTDSETSRGLNSPAPAVEHPVAIGRFQVTALLGQGAFGSVYRANDPLLSREVAIKVPKRGALKTDDDTRRFLREARAAATLNHPIVCPVYEIGDVAGRPYIVMALVEGKTLQDVLATGPEKTPLQTATLFFKLAEALDEAHEQKIVHRDLKPANIMINRRGEPVIMDFGLARLEQPGEEQLTRTGLLLGTPAYMSPEQARGSAHDLGPSTDIYTLGVILYEVLAGRRPHQGTLNEVLGKILHVDPPPPSQHRRTVDRGLEAICLKAMARDPAQRYASMKAFAAALDKFVQSLPRGTETTLDEFIPASPHETPTLDQATAQ